MLPKRLTDLLIDLVSAFGEVIMAPSHQRKSLGRKEMEG